MKKCFICEKGLESDIHGTVYGATFWTTYGNYGSSVYDPIGGGERLEAYVCDVCLVGKKHLLEEVRFQRNDFVVLERKEPDFGADHPEFKEPSESERCQSSAEE